MPLRCFNGSKRYVHLASLAALIHPRFTLALSLTGTTGRGVDYWAAQ